jgi:hypothetical protein
LASAASLVAPGCTPGHVVKRDDFYRVTTAFANVDGARARRTYTDVPLEQQDAPEVSCGLQQIAAPRRLTGSRPTLSLPSPNRNARCPALAL